MSWQSFPQYLIAGKIDNGLCSDASPACFIEDSLSEMWCFHYAIITKPVVCRFKVLAYFFCSFSCLRNKRTQENNKNKKGKFKGIRMEKVEKVERLNEKK